MTSLRFPPGTGAVQAARQSMPSTSVRRMDDASVPLWCDPLTGLVAYPSFAECLTAYLPVVASSGAHLAIGDVDDLRGYVNQHRADDPTHFGHLAGNACMQALGRVTRVWAERTLMSWPFALCGTFGGDEVIIAAAGKSYDEFVVQIHRLIRDIAESVPRTCSFSAGTLTVRGLTTADQEHAYRHFVSVVDAALFARKAALRAAHLDPKGDFEDVGAVALEPTENIPTIALRSASEARDIGSRSD